MIEQIRLIINFTTPDNIRNWARCEKNSGNIKVLFLVVGSKQNKNIAQNWVAYIFFVENIGLGAARNDTGCDNLNPVTA